MGWKRVPVRQPDGVQGACLWNQKAKVWASILSFSHLTICSTNIYQVPTESMYCAMGVCKIIIRKNIAWEGKLI